MGLGWDSKFGWLKGQQATSYYPEADRPPGKGQEGAIRFAYDFARDEGLFTRPTFDLRLGCTGLVGGNRLVTFG